MRMHKRIGSIFLFHLACACKRNTSVWTQWIIIIELRLLIYYIMQLTCRCTSLHFKCSHLLDALLNWLVAPVHFCCLSSSQTLHLHPLWCTPTHTHTHRQRKRAMCVGLIRWFRFNCGRDVCLSVFELLSGKSVAHSLMIQWHRIFARLKRKQLGSNAHTKRSVAVFCTWIKIVMHFNFSVC